MPRKTYRKRRDSKKKKIRRKTLKNTAGQRFYNNLKNMLTTSNKTHKKIEENAGNHSLNEYARMLALLYTNNPDTI